MSRVRVLPGFYFVLAFSLLLLPVRWCVAWVAAAFVHEMCHIAMVKLCRCRLFSVTVGAFGALIESDCQTELKKLLCTAAGPLGGAVLLLLAGVFPRVAICAAVQSLYNLLPFYALDGRKALACVIRILFPNQKTESILSMVEKLTAAAMVGLALYGALWLKLGIMPCVIVGILLIKNSLAKRGFRRYNREHTKIRGLIHGTNFTHSSEACPVYRRGVQ